VIIYIGGIDVAYSGRDNREAAIQGIFLLLPPASSNLTAAGQWDMKPHTIWLFLSKNLILAQNF